MVDETQNEMKEVPEIAPFDPTKKKKKKKITIVDPADPVEKLAEKTDNLSGMQNKTSNFLCVAVADGVETAFTGLKKKKKKPVEISSLNDETGDAIEDLDDHADEEKQLLPREWSYRDYEYEEGNRIDRFVYSQAKLEPENTLLGRVFNILRENNPELAGDRPRTVFRPPQVLRGGIKKTVFVNFMDLCESMYRQPDHVMAFLLAELGTSGALDGQQRLVVKGRFAPKDFETILRTYAMFMPSVPSYQPCGGNLSKMCRSGKSVAAITAGFVARVSRRNTGT
ncbi:hypothetical protein Fmac_031021 [Flemingia macrophylla]|uniref:Eukaryotic translation initiation factor 2 subunit beta n=1 Tax=Flemingia macrophylla TaxID=520843 RepID=A0ABD1L0U3_9FABA